MPIPVEFSQRDLSRGILVDVAWYRVHIDSVTTKPSKDAQSTNYNFEGTIIRNADTGDEKFKDVVLSWNFNSKAMGFAQGLFKALIGPDAVLEPGTRYDLQSAEGKDVDIFVENGEWNNNIVNRINHKYRYPKSA